MPGPTKSTIETHRYASELASAISKTLRVNKSITERLEGSDYPAYIKAANGQLLFSNAIYNKVTLQPIEVDLERKQ